MFHSPKRVLFLLALLLAATALFGQATTSTLVGTVTNDGKPLPGVTVTVTSPALLGTRDTVTVANGDYFFPALPPGNYDVTFELEGLQTVTRKATLKLAETARADADLKVSKVAESITPTETKRKLLKWPGKSRWTVSSECTPRPAYEPTSSAATGSRGSGARGSAGVPCGSCERISSKSRRFFRTFW